eukprot:NODE_35_length_31537_cov_0.293403.p17 type:complete len:149 gc:universal NODE_35_length_31537_cov_0.293403:19096-18650(-)
MAKKSKSKNNSGELSLSKKTSPGSPNSPGSSKTSLNSPESSKTSSNSPGSSKTSSNSPKSNSYYFTTDKLTQFFDTYLVYCLMTGVLLFGYCALFGSFPFNAFLAAFIYSVGCFVLVANLRNAENPSEFAEFVACALVLNAFVSNYLG